MSTATLIRWSGLAGILAAVLYAFGAVLHPAGEDIAAYTSANWVPSHLAYWASALLMQLGLVGIYARQAGRAGWLGLVGFVLAMAGTAFVGTIVYMVATVVHLVAMQAPALFEQATTPPTSAMLVLVLGFGLGYILLGIATIRASVFPRWTGLLLIVGVALSLAGEALPLGSAVSHALVTAGDLIFALGLAWLGYRLWAERRELARPGQLAIGASRSS
jgi:hypothetical protein